VPAGGISCSEIDVTSLLDLYLSVCELVSFLGGEFGTLVAMFFVWNYLLQEYVQH
jgi:hypothetical protein